MSALSRATLIVAVLLTSVVAGPASAAERFLVLASTTSTRNSGLLDHLLPQFKRESGISVRVVAVGTGQALGLGRRGDADALLVHHRASEDAFVAEGFGAERRDVMYNDFVMVGPVADPAAIRGMKRAPAALAKIRTARSVFVSRGDDSGTHKREQALWRVAGVDPKGAAGTWYREVGSGMGATLNTASAMDAYTLCDRGTWLSFANRGSLELLISGDELLWNPYGIILVNPKRHPHVRYAEARAFADWLVSAPGQAAIRAFKIKGEWLFHPNARPSKPPVPTVP